LLQDLFSDILCHRVLPATLFTLILVAKAAALAKCFQAPGALWTAERLSTALQHATTVAFLAVVVLLFAVRKPIVGRRSSLLGATVALAGAFTMSVPIAASVTHSGIVAMCASAILTIAGTAISIASLVALGRCFGVMPEARGLVTGGPYSIVRHPLYVGEAIATMGQVVVTATVPVIALLAVHFALQVWRSVNEEKALVQVFQHYEQYRRRTWRFIPGLV
jgi:protein-S-isoprenylcysteine O-methyltransferase Ste14